MIVGAVPAFAIDMTLTVYTIGHSTHSTEGFIELLKRNGIEAIADVRSSPYSRHNPQFNRETLKGHLARKRHRLCVSRGRASALAARTPIAIETARCSSTGWRRRRSFKTVWNGWKEVRSGCASH